MSWSDASGGGDASCRYPGEPAEADRGPDARRWQVASRALSGDAASRSAAGKEIWQFAPVWTQHLCSSIDHQAALRVEEGTRGADAVKPS